MRRRVLLLLGLMTLLAPPAFARINLRGYASGGSTPPAKPMPAAVSISPAVTSEPFFMGSDASLPYHWPDSAHLGVVQLAGQTCNGLQRYRFWAASDGFSSYVGDGTRDSWVACGYTQVTGNDITNMGMAVNYKGWAKIYQYSPTLWLMPYHVELHPTCGFACFYSMTRLAKSTDQGATWRDLGPIYSLAVPYNPACNVSGSPCGRDEGNGGSFIIKRDADGFDYFILYTSDWIAASLPETTYVFNGLVASRAKLSDVVSAANANTVTPFTKYYNGSWSQPAVLDLANPQNGGGLSSPLEPGRTSIYIGGSTVLPYTDVSWNTYLNRWIGVSPWNGRVQKIIESTDGLTWVQGAQINNVVIDPATSQGYGYYYTTIMGTGPDPNTTGQTFDVYFMRGDYGTPNRAQWRRTITFTD